jgi:hypothetical protein
MGEVTYEIGETKSRVFFGFGVVTLFCFFIISILVISASQGTAIASSTGQFFGILGIVICLAYSVVLSAVFNHNGLGRALEPSWLPPTPDVDYQ